MDVISLITGLALGLISGVVLAASLLRGKHRAQQELALANLQSSLQVSIATSQTRAEQAEAQARAKQEETNFARSQGAGWRDELDAARDQVAKLQERTQRIPEFESETTRLSSELDAAQSALQELSSSKSAFETTAARVPSLESKVSDTEQKLEDTLKELAAVREAVGVANASLEAANRALSLTRGELVEEKRLHEDSEAKVSKLTPELSGLQEKLNAEQQNATEKLDVLNKAQETLTAQFKVLANDILESNSKRFAEQNQSSLGQILDPLRQKLADFQKKVEDVYVEEGKDRSALKEQVQQLVGLNQSLSEDAKNLTSALRGSAKSQGNWGELILERVLEASGLRKGEEYFTQDSQTNDEGKRFQPDVVINLPDERRLVVDSKVSLVAYERYASAESDAERVTAMRAHLESVRNHIKGLSDKRYQNLYGQSLDFVLMFVPVEPAFMVAVTNDSQMFMDAWGKNVLLVSPSTLLFVVRTVAHLWRQEDQNRNAQEIAKRGAELYDKLVGFVQDLSSVGEKIGAAQNAYQDASKKLSTGRGNVIRQAQMLRELGVKPTKQLPTSMVDMSSESEDVSLMETGALPISHDSKALLGPVYRPET